MLKLAKILSIGFHPLFISFYNFLVFILLTEAKGAVLGFVVTLFFLGLVMIPVFYTFYIVYSENKDFHWEQLSDMSMLSRKKMMIYTIVYQVVFLLIIISLNEVFLGKYQAMFASIVMGFVFSMVLSLAAHLLQIKNSLHAMTASFLLTFCLIFSWKIPGIEEVINLKSHYFLMIASFNALLLVALVWSRYKLKAHTIKELAYGILIGIFSPVLLTLLTYGI
jgi:hypothetical protein